MGRAAFSTFSVDRAKRIFPPNFLTQFPIFQPSNAIQTQYEIPSDVVLNFQIFLEYQGCPMNISKDVKSISHHRTHVYIRKMDFNTDYGYTKAKSLILCGPHSNPNPK